MNRSITTLLILATALALVSPKPLLAQTATNNSKPSNLNDTLAAGDVVATGKGFTITRDQLDDEVIRIKATLAGQGRQPPPGGWSGLDAQILERLIQVKLVMAKATEADKTKGTEAAEKRVADERSRAPSEESFNRQLRALGLSPEEFLTRITEAAIVDAVLEHELEVKITEEEIKKYYEEHPARFEQPEMARVNHILFATFDPETRTEVSETQKQAKRKQAEEVLKRAQGGEDFVELAKKFSDDPGSRERGGEYYFPRGVMAPEFEAAAFALSTNQISEIVTTQFGYHIIKLTEKTPAQTVPLDKATPNIKQFLTFQEMQTQLPTYIAKLKEEAGVKVLDDKLKLPEKDAASTPAIGGGSAPGNPSSSGTQPTTK